MQGLKKIAKDGEYALPAAVVVIILVLLLFMGMLMNRDINKSTMEEAFKDVRAAWLAENCRAAEFHGASRGYIDSSLAAELGFEGIDDARASRANILKIRKFAVNYKRPKDGDWCMRANVRCIYGPANGLFSDSDWHCVRIRNYGG